VRSVDRRYCLHHIAPFFIYAALYRRPVLLAAAVWLLGLGELGNAFMWGFKLLKFPGKAGLCVACCYTICAGLHSDAFIFGRGAWLDLGWFG